MKKVLFLVRSAPYGSAAIPESVRACLGFGTMPLEVSYVLADDATWALLPDQQPEPIAGNDALALIRNLADLGVSLYVDEAALAARGLSVAGHGPEFTPLSPERIADLVAGADAVLTY